MASFSNTTPTLGTTPKESKLIGFANLPSAPAPEVQLKALRRTIALKQLGSGAVLFAIGLAITGISYSAASDGGTYLVMFGPIIGGGWMVLRGLYGLISA